VAPQRPPLLRAPVSIITPTNELELRGGSLLCGRLPECDVMVDDGLVSRMHARITVRDDSVVVEDLHSTNGVYVNGTRITHSAALREGDRLLLGTTEISLFEARPDARVTPLRLRRDDLAAAESVRPAAESVRPAAGRGSMAPGTSPTPARRSFGTLDLHLEDLELEPIDGGPNSKRSSNLKSGANRATAQSTARADALEVIGALAQRLAAGGNVDEARRVLSSHLKRILQGATAGLTVPIEVLVLASTNALSLAEWTGQSAWLDYVTELHLAGRRAMGAETFKRFESAVAAIGDFDRELFRYYVEGLRHDRSLLTEDEQRVLDRALALAGG